MARQRVFCGAVAALGGLVLLEALFLPWYRLERTIAGVPVESTSNAWQTMLLMDVALLLVALTAVAGGLAAARSPRAAVVPLAAGSAGVLLSLLGLVDLPEPAVSADPGDTAGVGREAGPFVALVASAGVALAGLRATRIRPRGRSRARPRPAPPPTAGRRSPGRSGAR
jgi:hypothetical protein